MGNIVDGKYEVASVVKTVYTLEAVEKEIEELWNEVARATNQIAMYNAKIEKLTALKAEMENAGIVKGAEILG